MSQFHALAMAAILVLIDILQWFNIQCSPVNALLWSLVIDDQSDSIYIRHAIGPWTALDPHIATRRVFGRAK